MGAEPRCSRGIQPDVAVNDNCFHGPQRMQNGEQARQLTQEKFSSLVRPHSHGWQNFFLHSHGILPVAKNDDGDKSRVSAISHVHTSHHHRKAMKILRRTDIAHNDMAPTFRDLIRSRPTRSTSGLPLCVAASQAAPFSTPLKMTTTHSPLRQRTLQPIQIQKPAGITAFFGITTMPSRTK